MLCCDAVHGGGAKREYWRPPHSPPDSSPPLRYPQSNWAPLVLVPEWACAHSRPLWISPTTSPVRLGVSPAAAPTPMGVFNQRFEALFPCSGALGCSVYFAPRCLSGLSVSECGAAGSACGRTACAVRPTLHQSGSHQGHVSPLRPSARLRPSYWSG